MKPVLWSTRRYATSHLLRQLPAAATSATSATTWAGNYQVFLPLQMMSPVSETQSRYLTLGAMHGQPSPFLWSAQASSSLRCAATISLTRPATKDPERPKRPTSAWLRFLAEYRKAPATKALAPKEVMTTAAGKWKVMSESEKAPFEGPAEQEKEIYRKAMDEYIGSGKKDAWARDPEKPKRPANAFFLYASKFRDENKGLSVTDATKQAKAAWDKLSDAQKAPLTKQAEAAKAQYAKDMEQYKASGKELAWQTKVGITAALKKKHEADEQQKAKKLEAAAKKKESLDKKKTKAKEAAAKKKLKLKELAVKKKELAAQKKEKEKLKKAATLKKAKELAMQKKEKEKLKKKTVLAKAKAVAAKLKLKKEQLAKKAKATAVKAKKALTKK